jgi:hypothetical protein
MLSILSAAHRPGHLDGMFAVNTLCKPVKTSVINAALRYVGTCCTRESGLPVWSPAEASSSGCQQCRQKFASDKQVLI